MFFSSFRTNSYISYLGVRLFGFLSSMSRWVLRFFSFLGELIICGGETTIKPFLFVFFLFLIFFSFIWDFWGVKRGLSTCFFFLQEETSWWKLIKNKNLKFRAHGTNVRSEWYNHFKGRVVFFSFFFNIGILKSQVLRRLIYNCSFFSPKVALESDFSPFTCGEC